MIVVLVAGATCALGAEVAVGFGGMITESMRGSAPGDDRLALLLDARVAVGEADSSPGAAGWRYGALMRRCAREHVVAAPARSASELALWSGRTIR